MVDSYNGLQTMVCSYNGLQLSLKNYLLYMQPHRYVKEDTDMDMSISLRRNQIRECILYNSIYI